MDQKQDQRKSPRFEHISTAEHVKFSVANDLLEGYILDISESGIAISLDNYDGELPTSGTVEQLGIIINEHNTKTIGQAIIKRTWSDSLFGLDHSKGIALQFINKITDPQISNLFFRGSNQENRIKAQENQILQDCKYLGDYRRDLMNCQMKLLITALTVGSALFSSYFWLSSVASTSHMAIAAAIPAIVATTGSANAVTTSPAIQNYNAGLMDSWRIFVIALPGFFALACALMAVTKAIAVRRIEAFLSAIKECYISSSYPRAFRGWETTDQIFKFVLRTNICDEKCKRIRKCGNLGQNYERLNLISVFKNPPIDSYYILMYSCFLVIIFSSFFGVIMELMRNPQSNFSLIFIGIIFTLLMLALTYLLIRNFYQLRKGKYSFDVVKRTWLDLIYYCHQEV